MSRRLRRVRPSFATFAEQAREYTVVPVWREVLADLETPLSAFAKLVGDREGFLLESVEHAERWGRFSFLGRDPGPHVRRARPPARVDRRDPPPGVPSDEGTLAALDALLKRYRAPAQPELPPFHGGIVGWIGYDTVREIERLPNVPARRSRSSRRGVLARRAGRRVRPFPPALLPDRERVPGAGPDDATLRKLYDAAVARLADAVAELGRPLPYVPDAPAAPTSSPSCPTSART